MPDPRETLAASQHALLAALHRTQPAPSAFNPNQLAATTAVLIQKRKKALLAAWPAIEDELQNRFDPLFNNYLDLMPTPPPTPAQDGRNFLHHLAAQNIILPNLLHPAFHYDLTHGSPVQLKKLGPRWTLGLRLHKQILILAL